MTNTFTKSSLVTGYDASVPYRPQYGAGGGRTVVQVGSINPGTTDATTVVYRMVRVPTSAVINKLEVALELNGGTATTFTGNIGLYWSDNFPYDGTNAIKSGTNAAVSDSFFTWHYAMAAVNTFTDATFQNATGNSVTDGFYTPSASFQPLWLALTSGGYQGLDATLNAPKGPWDGSNWSGLGAVSATSNDFYQLMNDQWQGFLDICFRPSSANSLSIATMIFSVRVTMTYPM